MAAFVATLHWIILVATVVIGCGGPFLVVIAWDIVHRTGPTDVASTENVRPTDTFNKGKRRLWSLDSYFFVLGLCVMWQFMFLALFRREEAMWCLLLGFCLPLLVYGIRYTSRILHNRA